MKRKTNKIAAILMILMIIIQCYTPIKVYADSIEPQVSAGYNHTVTLLNDGTVKAWGNNFYGQLGVGNTTNQSTPVVVPGLTNVKQIVAGEKHTLALLEDGTVKAWGDNSYGQVGTGSGTNKEMSPVDIPSLENVKQVVAGSHALALLANGKVMAWGFNGSGQLGLGDTSTRFNPVEIPGLTDVNQLAVGKNHSLALLNDGTVKAWGKNEDGQLGIGNTNIQTSPVIVPSLVNVKQLAGGYNFTLALLNDGTVMAWGNNSRGQLGTGGVPSNQSSIPIQVSNLTNVKQIAAGYEYALAVCDNGDVMAWGDNGLGQLGINNTVTQKIPVKVGSLIGVKQIAAGGLYTVALLNNGQVNAWGQNSYGQLGTGTTSSTSTPISVKDSTLGSGNNNLSALAISNGTLSSAFAEGTTDYTASVGNQVTGITVTATKSDAAASIKVAGSTVISGQASGNIPLIVGENIITVEVTAANGTTKTYTIKVTRAANNNNNLSGLTVSSGTLSPSFAEGTTDYTVNVGNAVTEMALTPTTAVGTASIKVAGSTVISGQASGNIPLIVGENTIDVEVTAENGSTKTYTIKVTRANSASTPVIDTSPNDATVIQGETVTLSIAASTTSGALSYQWYSNTMNSNSGGTILTGATGSSYLPSTASSGTTYYYCIVKSTLGTSTATATSNIASVTVNNPPPTVNNVTITPATALIQKGNTQTFSASVTGTNSPAQTVTWSVTGGVAGTSIDSSGKLTVAADETATELTVIATSTVDNTKSGMATVTVTDVPPPPPAVDNVTVTPATSSVQKGNTQTFSASVTGTNSPAQTVTWSVTGGVAGTSIDSSGKLTVAADETASELTVTATSTVDNTKSGTATVSVTNVSPPPQPSPTVDSGGGSGNASHTKTTTPNYSAAVSAVDTTGNNINSNSMAVEVDQKKGTAALNLGSQESKVIENGGTLDITVPSISGVTGYTLGIPVATLKFPGQTGVLTFRSNMGSISIPANMLTGITAADGTKAEIGIRQGDKSGLPETAKTAIGDRPLIQLQVTIDGKQIEWNNPNSPITISIPYKPTEAELANPESIVIWYIDGSGNAVSVPNGHYDSATGTVTFTTTHFSDYAVGYSKVEFTDVLTSAWYDKAVSFIAARGITSGTGNSKYSPQAKLTRGEFLVMMMKAYGISADGNPTSNFSDAGNTYYTGYLAAAKRLDITDGVGNNRFAPNEEITRQEMFALLYNTLKQRNELPASISSNTMTAYSDADEVANWAKPAMTWFVETGGIKGENSKLLAAHTTTRAEMAQVLYLLLIKN